MFSARFAPRRGSPSRRTPGAAGSGRRRRDCARNGSGSPGGPKVTSTPGSTVHRATRRSVHPRRRLPRWPDGGGAPPRRSRARRQQGGRRRKRWEQRSAQRPLPLTKHGGSVRRAHRKWSIDGGRPPGGRPPAFNWKNRRRPPSSPVLRKSSSASRDRRRLNLRAPPGASAGSSPTTSRTGDEAGEPQVGRGSHVNPPRLPISPASCHRPLHPPRRVEWSLPALLLFSAPPGTHGGEARTPPQLRPPALTVSRARYSPPPKKKLKTV